MTARISGLSCSLGSHFHAAFWAAQVSRSRQERDEHTGFSQGVPSRKLQRFVLSWHRRQNLQTGEDWLYRYGATHIAESYSLAYKRLSWRLVYVRGKRLVHPYYSLCNIYLEVDKERIEVWCKNSVCTFCLAWKEIIIVVFFSHMEKNSEFFYKGY